MYFYIQSEKNLWTVGYESQDGNWHPDSDHDSRESAAEKVATLNGFNQKKISELEERISELESEVQNLRTNAGLDSMY